MDSASLGALPEDLVRRASAALDGGRAIVPLPRLGDEPLPEGTALVVRTSGSTGSPREVALSGSALLSSATATHARLGGPGRWVLTLPPTHVAGVQVTVRAALAARAGVPEPLVVSDGGPFTPSALAALLGRALHDDAPVYVSLVPTQLHRVLAEAEAGDPAALDALVRCGAVLLGGAAAPPPLLARATTAGVRVVRTYGMSETAGGCVYDGRPLDGATVRLVPSGPGSCDFAQDDEDRGSVVSSTTGVVEIAGPTLATCYLGDPDATAAAFRTDPDGTRWFRTSDLGSLSPDGTLAILGRADDVVVTGGVNVAPAPVEALLADVVPGLLDLPHVEPCVVGVPDPEWGQAVVAVLAVPGGPEALTAVGPHAVAQVRERVAATLGAPSAPRRVYLTGSLPLRGPGKIDRRAVAAAVPTA